MDPGKLLISARRFVRWHRRWLIAALVGVAVLAGLKSIGPTTADSVEVLVAARRISGGAQITAADLTVARLSVQAVPEGALTSPEQATGKTIVATVPQRRPLTVEDLVGEGHQLESGQVALPISFSDAAPVELLQSGSRIDILGASQSGSGFGVVATDVRVVTVPATAATGLGSSGSAGTVLVAVSAAQATAIAASTSVSTVSFALR